MRAFTGPCSAAPPARRGAPLMTDQRGESRPETGGTLCDVGAFERQTDDP